MKIVFITNTVNPAPILTLAQKGENLRRLFSKLCDQLYNGYNKPVNNRVTAAIFEKNKINIEIIENLEQAKNLDMTDVCVVYFSGNDGSTMSKDTVMLLCALSTRCTEAKLEACDFVWI